MKVRQKLGRLEALLDLPARILALEHRQESRLNRMLELFREKPRHAVATLLVFGSREEGGPLVALDAQQIKLWDYDNSQKTLQAQAMVPAASFQMVVLADLERVELLGMFKGADLMGGLGATPIAFGKDWYPGQQLRAIVRLRGD